jgi:hypothetical protein
MLVVVVCECTCMHVQVYVAGFILFFTGETLDDVGALRERASERERARARDGATSRELRECTGMCGVRVDSTVSSPVTVHYRLLIHVAVWMYGRVCVCVSVCDSFSCIAM